MKRIQRLAGSAFASLLFPLAAAATANERPNFLIIWGDDVDMWNISVCHGDMMGGETPNIRRLASEGMVFMDRYAHSSCTAGRAAFITGHYPIRTGLGMVGLPGAAQGLSKEDPTLAEMLKSLGYATGQFGKNHLGDRHEHLPTEHGFDEFFGILYHLNAGEYPEQYDYIPDLAERGVIHSWPDRRRSGYRCGDAIRVRGCSGEDSLRPLPAPPSGLPARRGSTSA